MPSLLPDFEYDIFISYRHNDNRSGWVTEFVSALREELAATIKDPVTIYFDENPHDGLLDTHHVDKSLEGKLKCLIFIPILSHTYCDPKSFAWNNEFLVFGQLAKADSIGMDVRLANRNVTGRILPVQIHVLDGTDQRLFENANGGPLRSIDFTFKSHGVNRPLTPKDDRTDNLNKTFYRDQVNKTANAIEGIISALTSMEAETSAPAVAAEVTVQSTSSGIQWFWHELLRRNVFRAAITYLLLSLIILQLLTLLTPVFNINENAVKLATWTMLSGFPLAMIFAWFFEVSPQGIIRTTSEQSAINPYPPHRKKPLTSPPLVYILLLALVSQFIYQRFRMDSPSGSVSNEIISIAVLPFEDRSKDKNDHYFAEGITDDIINRLAIISRLRVTNRVKIQQYQGKLVPFDEIANTLQVTKILTGSVERSDKQIVIRAQLVDGQTNAIIWGSDFKRTKDNIVPIQSEIAQAVADKLDIDLNETEKLRLQLKATDNPTAYDYYLQGRSLYYKYRPSANDSAVEQFKLAISLDARYARAWAGLGDAYSQMHRNGRDIAWLDSSVAAGTRAVQLDSNLSEAYKALSTAYNYKKLYDKAFPLLQKSVELNPNNEAAVGNLGTNYFFRGDFPEAIRLQKESARLNPNNFIPYQITGLLYNTLGDHVRAEQWLKESLELNPNYAHTYEILAYTYVALGRNEDALKLVPRVLQIGPNESRILEKAGIIAHYAGDTENAKVYFQRSIDTNPSYKTDPSTISPVGLGQILQEEGKKIKSEIYLTHMLDINLNEIKKGSQDDDPRFRLAGVYAIMGNKDQSLAWLQKAIDANWLDYAQVIYGPWFSNFRTDPAFLEMIEPVRKKAEAMRLKAAAY